MWTWGKIRCPPEYDPKPMAHSIRVAGSSAQGRIQCFIPSLCIRLIHLLANSLFHSPHSFARRVKVDERSTLLLAPPRDLSARDPLLEGFFNLFVTDAAGGYAGAWMGTWGTDACDSLL